MAYEDRIMRMAGSVPQRTTRPDTQQAGMDRWNANRRYEQAQMLMNEPGARAKEAEVARDFGGNIRSFTPHLSQGFEPGQGGRYGFPGNWPGTPIGLGKDPEWHYTTTPGDPLEHTRRSGMDSGEYLASRFGGGIDDAAGMNESARGMIEDAGFDVAASEGMTDKRVFRDLWAQSVNKFPVGTPDMIIQQEWERLKQIYRDKKYGGGTGLALPSRDDIVGLG